MHTAYCIKLINHLIYYIFIIICPEEVKKPLNVIEWPHALCGHIGEYYSCSLSQYYTVSDENKKLS